MATRPVSPTRIATVAVLAAALASGPGGAAPASVRAAGSGPPQPFISGEVVPMGRTLDHVVLVIDELIDPSSMPAPGDFAVTIGEDPATPVDVTFLEHVFSGFAGIDFGDGAQDGLSFIRLDLSQPVDPSSVVRVSYTGTAIRDLSLEPMGTFPPLTMELVEDDQTLSSWFAVVDGYHGADKLLIFFPAQLDEASIPLPDRFAVRVGDPAAAVAVDAVTLLHPELGVNVLELDLASAVPPGAPVRFDYTPGANPISHRWTPAEAEPIVDAEATVLVPSNSASQNADPDEPVSTVVGDGPTPTDPIATTVTAPDGGPISITEGTFEGQPPSGYSFFGQQIVITAPVATAGDPLRIEFYIDSSLVPEGETYQTVQIARNGEVVPPCSGPAGTVAPEPACVAARGVAFGDDVILTVLATEASTWNWAVLTPFDFGGFLQPVDAGRPNLVRAGQAVPVKFSLGGDRGLGIFAAGYPRFESAPCGSTTPDLIEQTVTAGSSSLTYDADSDIYTYVWKTSPDWEDRCGRLQLTFVDGSAASADFDFRT
jgi:hypothetical protein